jgi:hypothetical protein
MNKEESEMWDIRRIPARPEMVEVIVRMTPEEYERVRTNAAWGRGGSVSEYLKQCGLGNNQRRGC